MSRMTKQSATSAVPAAAELKNPEEGKAVLRS